MWKLANEKVGSIYCPVNNHRPRRSFKEYQHLAPFSLKYSILTSSMASIKNFTGPFVDMNPLWHLIARSFKFCFLLVTQVKRHSSYIWFIESMCCIRAWARIDLCWYASTIIIRQGNAGEDRFQYRWPFEIKLSNLIADDGHNLVTSKQNSLTSK